MTIEERAPITDKIINALSNGSKPMYILKQETGATHNDLSFVEEQSFVQVAKGGLADSNIIYILKEKGRELHEAKGLINYKALKAIEKERLLAKDELEKQLMEFSNKINSLPVKVNT